MEPQTDMQRVVARMAPGVCCLEGFLGDDERPLAMMLADDAAMVASAGTTHREIAAALSEVLAKVAGIYGTPVGLRPGVTAVFHESMGRIPCPYGDGVYAKGDVELRQDAGPGEEPKVWRFTPLSIHLIEAHGFYQGRGTRYRLEPGEIAKVLGL